MAEQFSVGDLAICQNGTHYAQHDGALCVVTGGLAIRRGEDRFNGKWVSTLCYSIEILVTPKVGSLARPHQLRPLKGEPTKALPRVEEEPVV